MEKNIFVTFVVQNTKQIAGYTNIRKNMKINKLKMIIKLSTSVVIVKKNVIVDNQNGHMSKNVN